MSSAERKQFYKTLRGLAVPLALQNLLHALVGASDALMLGRLTQEAIAAVSLANEISFVMSLFHTAFIGAIAVYIAQYRGKGDHASSKKYLAMAVRYAAGISLVFFLVTFSMPTRLMRIFTPEAELIAIGAGYLRIVSFSYLFTGISLCFLTMMKVAGAARLGVIISAVTVLVDMTVDFFLIYGIGPVPALGANGSAYSTIAVEALALLICILWARRREDIFLKREELFHFSWQLEKDVWKVIPGMLASSLSWGLSIAMHSFIMGHLGTDATAAHAVTAVAQELISCVTQGIATAAGVMIGEALGANALDTARRYGREFWKVALFSGLFNIALLGIAGPLVYHFYVLSGQAKAYLVEMLILSGIYMFAYAFNTIIVCGVFPAGGDSKYDAISVLLATWCFAIPLSLLGLFVFRWSILAVHIVMCLDEIVKVPFLPLRYRKYIWLKNLTREE